jgi:superfamily II DNA helicase RecQ
MGFNTAVVNANTWGKDGLNHVRISAYMRHTKLTDAIQDLAAGKYDVIISSPEMCLDHSRFRPILADPSINQYLSHVAVDEAHYINEWGQDCQKTWADISTIRCLISKNTPFLALSATMSADVLKEVRRVLCIHAQYSYHVNLGNDRLNISQIVIHLQHGENPLERLSAVLNNFEPDETGRLPHALCFFDSRTATQKGCMFIKDSLAEELRSRVHYIHGGSTRHGCRHTITRFINHEIDILCVTECVGLCQNIADIEIVVVIKVPMSLPMLIQYIGCGGRNGKTARAVTLVEAPSSRPPSSSKSSRSSRRRRARESSQNPSRRETSSRFMPTTLNGPANITTFRRKIDPDLRKYLSETVCHRNCLHKLFGNPSAPTPSVPCCDLCLMATLPARSVENMLAELDRLSPLRSYPPKPRELLALLDAPSHTVALLTRSCEPNTEPADKVVARNDQLRARLHAELVRWRIRTFLESYSSCSFGVDILLGDDELDVISRDMSLTTLDALQLHPVVKDWHFLEQEGENLLRVVAAFDEAEGETSRRALLS